MDSVAISIYIIKQNQATLKQKFSGGIIADSLSAEKHTYELSSIYGFASAVINSLALVHQKYLCCYYTVSHILHGYKRPQS